MTYTDIAYLRQLAQQYTGEAKARILRVCAHAESMLPREPEYQWCVNGWRAHDHEPNCYILPTLETAETQAQYLMRHTYVRVEIARQEKPA